MFVAAAYVRTESAQCLHGVFDYNDDNHFYLSTANVEDCKTECDARGPSCGAFEFQHRTCYFYEQCVIELYGEHDVYMKEGLLF